MHQNDEQRRPHLMRGRMPLESPDFQSIHEQLAKLYGRERATEMLARTLDAVQSSISFGHPKAENE